MKRERFDVHTIHAFFASAANVVGSPTDLMAYTMQKALIAQDYDFLEVIAFGQVTGNINTKSLKAYLGATEIFSFNFLDGAYSDIGFQVRMIIARVNATSQKISSSIVGPMSSNNTDEWGAHCRYVEATENLSNALVLKFVGDGGASDDVIQQGMIIKQYQGTEEPGA